VTSHLGVLFGSARRKATVDLIAGKIDLRSPADGRRNARSGGDSLRIDAGGVIVAAVHPATDAPGLQAAQPTHGTTFSSATRRNGSSCDWPALTERGTDEAAMIFEPVQKYLNQPWATGALLTHYRSVPPRRPA